MNRLSHGELVQLAEEGRRKKMPRYIDAAPYEDGRIVLNKEDDGVPVAEIPTADVVEVVRCQACKHHESIKMTNGYLSYCRKHRLIDDLSSSDFCSDGERKEKTDVE